MATVKDILKADSRLVFSAELHGNPIHLMLGDAFRRECVDHDISHVVMLEASYNLLETHLSRIVRSRPGVFFNQARLALFRLKAINPAEYQRLQHMSYGSVTWGNAPVTRQFIHRDQMRSGTSVILMDMARMPDNSINMNDPSTRAFVRQQAPDIAPGTTLHLRDPESMRLRNIWMMNACRRAAADLAPGVVLACVGSSHVAGDLMPGMMYTNSMLGQAAENGFARPVTLFPDSRYFHISSITMDGRQALAEAETFVLKGLASDLYLSRRFPFINRVRETNTLRRIYNASGWDMPGDLGLIPPLGRMRAQIRRDLLAALDKVVADFSENPGLTPR